MQSRLLIYKITGLFILAVLAVGKLQAQNLTVSIADDSLYACLGNPLLVTASASGGSGSLTWVWSNGQTGDTSFFLASLPAEWLLVVVIDGNGNSATDSVLILGLPECVLPGDADGNGLANNLDVLPVAQLFNQNGPLRPNAHTNFIAQPAPDWGLQNSAGVDGVHSDADGDGLVNWADFAVIEHNYFHPQQWGNSLSLTGGVPLYVVFPQGPFDPGDTIEAAIMLGTASIPASQIMGVAFSVTYDQALIDSGSVRVEYSDSWLGDLGVDMGAAAHDFADLGQLDVGLGRTNGVARTGYGKVGSIIVAIDDITGKQGELLNIGFWLTNVSLLDMHGNYLGVDTDAANIQISLNNETLRPDLPLISIYPNPASTYLEVKLEASAINGSKVYVYDMLGRLQLTSSFSAPVNRLDISHLAAGTYSVQIHIKNQIISNCLYVY